MGSLHHAHATTTGRARNSSETLAVLAARYPINPKTMWPWKHAGRLEDTTSGPCSPRSTVLAPEEEQAIFEFRHLTRFSVDDVYISRKPHLPALSRSNWHRCLVRHGLNRLELKDGPQPDGAKKSRSRTMTLTMSLSTSRKFGGGKYAYVELRKRMTQPIARSFLEHLIKDCPFTIHPILTENGPQFTYALLPERLRPQHKIHLFDQTCAAHRIRHRLAKFRHPGTNGQVEVFNQKIKGHTLKRDHYATANRLKPHLMAFLARLQFSTPPKGLEASFSR